MTKKHQVLKRSERWRSVHMWAGLISAAVLLCLVITGILLNHTDDLRLDTRHVTYAPVLKWYGFRPPERAARIDLGDSELLQLDEVVFLNGQRMFESAEPILIACEWQGLIALITQAEIALFTRTAEQIESLALPGLLANNIDRVACGSGGPIIASAEQFYRTDQLLTDWRPVAQPPNLVWPDPQLLGFADRTAAYGLYHQRSLTWERLMLDLHSGRLLGLPGVLLVDAAALLLLLQLLSGIYLFWVKNR